jgi:two-component system sensor histidine kinase KdpD
VRSAGRLAQQLGLDWHAVHVETARALGEAARLRVQRTLELAKSLGARTALLSAPEVAPALVGYAREHNLSRLVVGRRESVWRWPGRLSLAEALSRLAGDMDVLQVALPTATREVDAPAQPAKGLVSPQSLRGYAAAVAGVGLTTLLALPLLDFMAPTNIAMLFLLTVVGVALKYGRPAAALSALLGVAAFDVVFVEPRGTFAVSDAQYLVTFAVLLLVGLVIGQLAAGLQAQAKAAQERERRVRGLYAMSRDLGAALVPAQVAEIAARFLRAEFGTASAVRAPPLQPSTGRELLAVLPGAGVQPDLGVAQWAFDHGQPAGQGTNTLPASHCLMLPLTAPMRLRGVLAVESKGRRWLPDERELLDTCAALLAISLERIHYIEVAQQSTLQIESERLRNSLLTAISHDLRTPLAALVGLADALRLAPPALSPAQAEVAEAMRRSALRMSALVSNLLDMAKLQSGSLQLNRQWMPLQEVVGTALASMDETLAGREVGVELPAELPLLQLDAVLIERVLVNLLENAAKYTPPGSPIRISARVAGQQMEIDVADEGPGFPAGREAQLFDKFERGDRESSTPGVGLGLAICKTIVEAHGGRISAHNGARGGARVRMELPLGQPPAQIREA